MRSEAAPADVMRALIHLALARFDLNRSTRAMLTAAQPGPAPLDQAQSALVDRVAYVIPRVAAQLPWRADCLVQALAARSWLARQGIATRLTLGVPSDKPRDFEAHAWLTAGHRIVTGGDVSGYLPLERP